jgi:hypothetical protein
MIEQLQITNYKSIAELKIVCKKINVFIGEPNSGKSNIIEALALMSSDAIGTKLNRDLFRYKTVSDLFFDFNLNTPIGVKTDDSFFKLEYAFHKYGSNQNRFILTSRPENKNSFTANIEHDGTIISSEGQTNSFLRFYEYQRINQFQNVYTPYLSVPHGENLPVLLLANKELKKWVSEFVQSKGL